MDERLGAGRHHLTNGDRALHLGYLDESRAHFEAALLQFRGPELRLGEAHALRGLAQVELGCGNLELAEDTARNALQAYRALRETLRFLAPEAASSELWREMETGEAGTLVLLGDLLTRVGRLNDARSRLGEASTVLDHLGGAALGAVQAALGRLALREGNLNDARVEFQRSLLSYELSADVVGQCTVHVARGELERLRGDLPAAESALGKALELAKKSLQPGLQGRALAAWAGLLVQLRRLREAREAYEQSLPLIRAAGDTEIEGFALLGLGEILSRDGEAEATATLVEGAQLVGRLGHIHGLAGGMLRLAQHALFLRDPELALAAADSARQLFASTDPVRGAGQALRLEVKALGQMKEWPATVAAAHLRASLAGASQPNALEVQAFYRARAPQPWLDELDRWTPAELEARAVGLINQVLGPVLAQMGLDPPALGTLGGAVGIVGAFHRAMTPFEELMEVEPDLGDDLDELPSDALEEIPPEDLPEAPIASENLAAPPRRRSVLTPIQAPERVGVPASPVPEPAKS